MTECSKFTQSLFDHTYNKTRKNQKFCIININEFHIQVSSVQLRSTVDHADLDISIEKIQRILPKNHRTATNYRWLKINSQSGIDK